MISGYASGRRSQLSTRALAHKSGCEFQSQHITLGSALEEQNPHWQNEEVAQGSQVNACSGLAEI